MNAFTTSNTVVVADDYLARVGDMLLADAEYDIAAELNDRIRTQLHDAHVDAYDIANDDIPF